MPLKNIPQPFSIFTTNNSMKLSKLNTSMKLEENICSNNVILIMMVLLTSVKSMNVLKRLNNNGELMKELSNYVEKLPVTVLSQSLNVKVLSIVSRLMN